MRGPVMDSHKQNMFSLLYSEKELNEMKNNSSEIKDWQDYLKDVRRAIIGLGLLVKSHNETCDECDSFVKKFYHPKSNYSIYLCLETECEDYLQPYPPENVLEMINELLPGDEEE